MELLLACARSRLDAAGAQRIRDLSSRDIDEERFWELAARHCVEPLAFQNLVAHGAELTGSSAFAAARRRFRRNSHRNLRFTRELLAVLDLLQAGGVQGVPYKGPLLAQEAYGNLLARSFHDLDIAVRRADLLAARDLLWAAGYQSSRTRNPREEAAYVRDSHEYELRSSDGRFVVELHSRFSARAWPTGFLPEDLWPRLVPVRLMGREVLSFPADALVSILAGHGAGHQWMRLDWIVALAEHVAAHPALDWERVSEQARVGGLLRATRLGLVLAHDLLGAPVPRQVLEEARSDVAVAPLMSQTKSRLYRGPGESPPRGEWLTYALACRERFRDRWPFFTSRLRATWRDSALGEDGMRSGRLLRRLRLVIDPGFGRLAWKLLRG